VAASFSRLCATQMTCVHRFNH